MMREVFPRLASRLSSRLSAGLSAGLGYPAPPGDAAGPPGPTVAAADLVRGMDAALACGHIHLAYQPKLCLRSGRINGVEALARWQHPRFGNVPPGVFIPALEAGGRIRELTLWALERALRDHSNLETMGFPLTIFVNVSGLLLTDAEFAASAGRLAPDLRGRVGFEITENSFIENHDAAMRHLRDFVGLGIEVSIDDYGAGLSSLTYLKEFPAAELKIDRLFVSELTSCHRNPLIVRSTIDLAHALGMRVVAEGVESLAALALLRAMGCDLIQGFVLSRALPVARLPSFLASDEHVRLLEAATSTIDAPLAFWARGRPAAAPATSRSPVLAN